MGDKITSKIPNGISDAELRVVSYRKIQTPHMYDKTI